MTPLAALASPASAATPNPNTPEQVASGISASQLPGATVFDSTPASTPETVSFVLREQNVGSLQAQVERGVKNYLSVSQVASTYGQTRANISALTSYLAGFGIKSDVYADNVDVSTTGTAGEYDQALSVTQNQYHVPAQAARDGINAIPAQTVHGNAKSPLLPYRLSKFVLAILGLTNYSPYGSQAVHVNTNLVKPQSGSSNYCLALTGLPDACNLPQNFASNYGLDGLYNRGANGSGQTIAIVTLAALDPGAPEYFWSNVAHIPSTGRTVTVDNVDGGPGAPSDASGTGETDLDVEQSGGLAPGANVIVYQAPNTDYGFADAFFSAASDNIASTVSASWLESETTWRHRSWPARKPRPMRPRSTRPSSRWRRRASPASSHPATGGRTPPPSTSAPPTSRSACPRTARTSPPRAAPRCPGPARSPDRTVRRP